MVSPEDFDEPRREAVILVPGADAMVQDLGPYHSGCAFETDLLPGSALVALAAPADPARPSVRADGQVLFAFEGNAFGATHLRRYHERCLLAAARLSSRAPSIAYGVAPASALHPVARFDLLRRVFVELLDGPAIKSWSGDALEDFLPPRDLVTPTSDPAATAPLCARLHRPRVASWCGRSSTARCCRRGPTALSTR